MIRYVIAVVLLAAIVALAVVGVDYTATTHGEREVTSAIDTIEDEALKLYETEDVPADDNIGPRRVIEVDLPQDRVTSAPVVHLQIEQVGATPASSATYRVAGGSMESIPISVPLQSPSGDTVDLSGEEGSIALTLELREVNGERLVVVHQP